MAKNEHRRLSSAVLADDETVYQALQKITGYAPTNPGYAVAALTQAFADMQGAQAEAVQKAVQFYKTTP